MQYTPDLSPYAWPPLQAALINSLRTIFELKIVTAYMAVHLLSSCKNISTFRSRPPLRSGKTDYRFIVRLIK